MKRTITGILALFVLFSSCSNSVTSPDATPETGVVKNDSLESVAMQHIYSKINKLPNTSFKDTAIVIGDRSIQIKIRTEFDGKGKGRDMYAAAITTFIRNSQQTQIDVGSIGIGSSRNEAMSVCIEEWFGSFGIAFTNMLNGTESIDTLNMKVFPGLMGIRGKLPANAWKGEDVTKNIISLIRPLINNTAGEIIPVEIKLMVGQKGITEGECRINNRVSEPLYNSLKHLNWPSSDEGFMFKQFYLVEIVK